MLRRSLNPRRLFRVFAKPHFRAKPTRRYHIQTAGGTPGLFRLQEPGLRHSRRLLRTGDDLSGSCTTWPQIMIRAVIAALLYEPL